MKNLIQHVITFVGAFTLSLSILFSGIILFFFATLVAFVGDNDYIDDYTDYVASMIKSHRNYSYATSTTMKAFTELWERCNEDEVPGLWVLKMCRESEFKELQYCDSIKYYESMAEVQTRMKRDIYLP